MTYLIDNVKTSPRHMVISLVRRVLCSRIGFRAVTGIVDPVDSVQQVTR